MGFWKAMSNIAQGKPVFETPTQSAQQADVQQPTESSDQPRNKVPTDSHGRKVIPRLELKNCKTHWQSSTIEVTVWVENVSNMEIELDKITMLGQRMEIDRRLNAGHSHEVVIYRGIAPKNDDSHKASLYYRSILGDDYFCADYTIEYDLQSNGLYSLEELKPENYGIRDI